MAGKTAYHKEIAGLVHTDLSDEEFKTHMALGTWQSSPEGDEQVAAEAEQKAEQPQPPAGNASLEAWQEFARSEGATDADLDGKTRDELRSLYA